MSFNIISTYEKFGGGGGTTGTGDFILIEGGTDRVLQELDNSTRILQEDGFKILLEGGTDELLTESRRINRIGG